MVTINTLNEKTTGTQVDYTVNFEGTSHNISGSLIVSSDDIAAAFKNNQGDDVFSGLKNFLLKRLQEESTNALNSK